MFPEHGGSRQYEWEKLAPFFRQFTVMRFWYPKRRRTRIVLLALLALVATVSRPVYFLARTVLCDRDERISAALGVADDASRLNSTSVESIWNMPSDELLAEQELRKLLQRAKQDKLHVSIAGARHSMGGQTIYPGGVQINMLPYHEMELSDKGDLLHVEAGALWSEIIPYLDRHGKSVAVMQSNNPFSVGGSLSVNCHGWQANRPPIASTVESFRIMLANGTVQNCSRAENAELFSAALGGYGLFGIILDARLHVVPNVQYRMQQIANPTKDFLAAWDQHVGDQRDVGMALGRLSVASDNFLDESLLYVFTKTDAPPQPLAGEVDSPRNEFARTVFRTSVDSDYGKSLRWTLERDLATRFVGEHFTRNQILNEPAETLANRTNSSTDILHEYFVPRERLLNFLGEVKAIVPRHHGNLLNVTIRQVLVDRDALLRYADRDMVSLVMLFNQERTTAGDLQMTPMTQELIDAALNCGGRFYLPYRLHATPEQFRRGYPMAEQFFALKMKYDPDELFQNQFYLQYGNQW
jgi:FAD/FMN-containing dehydrogenase